ncbi:MAG: glutamate-1-semialdehyde 2,1-aminomutase [Phycisphaerae bacterium]
MKFDRSNLLRARSHAAIPGGAHTYAKGDDQYPKLAPGFIARGKGCRVWDVDGNEFIEYGSGLRAVTLGHAHPAVVEAARRELERGCNFVRPSPLEMDLAEQVLAVIEGGEMVKFGKHGSDATSAAVKLSRAYTGRDLVAICGDHPFFSCDDWFIGTTPMPGGIPQTIRDLTAKFAYNDLASLEALFDKHPKRIACVMLEVEKDVPPAPGFLEGVKALAHGHGAVLVFDEVITGFRWHVGGAQRIYGVRPDLTTLGKGIANGFSVSAIVGKREIMKAGGIKDHDGERVFLLSTTHGGETHALAAAIATIDVYRKEDVCGRMHAAGERLRTGIERAARQAGVAKHFTVSGRACNLVFGTRDADGKPSQAMRALFMQEAIRRGVLGPSFVVNYAHADADIDATVERVGEALGVYRKALEDGAEKYLVGGPTKVVFRARC